MSEKIIKNSIIVLVLIALGKGLSFLRDIVISSYFGATSATDAYFAANNVPSILFTALISSYLVLLIPKYKDIQLNEGNDAANRFGSSLINFMLVIGIILSACGFFGMEYLIKMVAPGFGQGAYELAVQLGKILVLSFPFSGVALVLANVSNANKKYYATQLIPIFSATFVMLGVYLFAPYYGVFSLAVSGVLAFVFQLVIQVFISRKHFRYYIKSHIFGEHIKKMTILALPILLGFSVDNINLLVNSMIASGLPEGNLSALNYAQRLQFTLIGTVSTAVITVVYPLMSEFVAKNDKAKLLALINKSIKGIALIMLPIAVFFAINSELVIRIIFNRGKFDDTAVMVTSSVFFFYAINVLILSVREFILRIFYVYNETKQPLISSIISVLINVVLSLFLVKFLGVEGLSLANLLATIVSVLVLLLFLRKKGVVIVKGKSLFMFIYKLLIPIGLFVGLQLWIGNLFQGLNKYILVFLVFGIPFVVYYISLVLFKQQDVLDMNNKLKARLKK